MPGKVRERITWQFRREQHPLFHGVFVVLPTLMYG